MHSFSSYTNRTELGRGGMSTVYRATAPDGGTVALKALAIHLAADPNALRRFEVEIKLLSELVHPNIVRLLDADLRGMPPFLVIEYVEGDSLDKIVTREGPQSTKRLAPILIDMGYALDYAHTRGIIHRDVKPGNIMVRRSNGRALLTDFGVAKSADLTAFTSTNARVGSVYYMSPEQIEGRLEITRVSDVYSLGVTAYLALTGKHPFEGGNEIAIAKQHIELQPVHVSDVNNTIPRDVGDVVMKALSKRTYKRFQTAGEFARRFRDAVAGVEPSLVEQSAPVAVPRTRPVTVQQRPNVRPAVERSAAPRPAAAPARSAPAPSAHAQPAARPATGGAPPAVVMQLITGMTFFALCCAIVAVGASVIDRAAPISLSNLLPQFRPATTPAETLVETPYASTPLPSAVTVTPTVQLRTIATDIAETATATTPTPTPISAPTLDAFAQSTAAVPQEPVVVYEIVTATPGAQKQVAYATATPRLESWPTRTPAPRPLPKPVYAYPTPPVAVDPREPPNPVYPTPGPLRSPLAIITAAP